MPERRFPPPLLCVLAFTFALAFAASAPADVVNSDSRQSVKSFGGQSLSGTVEPHFGMFRTSVPISIPPGTGGVQPALALTYSSSSRGGNAGKGWSLTLPAIVLDRRFGAYNAQNWTVASSVFLLNGDRLVRSGSTEPVPPDLGSCMATRYHTEVDNFSKILLCEISAAGPYWVVLQKNGVRSTYGYRSEAQSKLVVGGKAFEYYLDEVRDSRGLSWRATYTRYGDPDNAGDSTTTSAPHLARVEYTYHNGAALGEIRTVDVAWDPRPDPDVDYFYGFELKSDRRIRAIQTELGGARVSRYALTYDSDPATPAVEDLSPDSKASLLYSIQRFGVEDGDSLPATTFRYQFNVPTTGSPGFSTSPTPLGGETFNADGTTTATCGSRTFDYLDINGDGVLDSVDAAKAKDSANPHWDVKLGTGNGGYQANPVAWKINTGGAMPLIQEIARPAGGCATNGGWPNIIWALVDMNGDRRPDLYGQGIAFSRPTPPFSRAGVVLLNNGTGFDKIALWAEPGPSAYLRTNGNGSATEHRFRKTTTDNTGCTDGSPCPLDTYSRSITLDVDGDGCADRFELDYTVTNDPPLPAKPGKRRPFWLFFHNRKCDPTPFNGFGAPIVWSWPSGLTPPEHMVHERDAVSRHATGSCHCQPGQDPIECCTNIGVITKSIYGHTTGLIDINQDGLIDFVSSAEGVLGPIYLGTGNGFIAQTSATSYDGSGWTNELRQGGIVSAHYDINGDGLKDAVSFDQDFQYLNCLQSNNNQSCAKTPGPWYWSVRLNTGTRYAPAMPWLAWDGLREFAWIQGGYGSTTDASGAYTLDYQLRDMDGDGLLEVVRNGKEAFKSTSRDHPDLLTTISNGFGGTLIVSYATVVSGPPGSAIGGNLASPTVVVSRTILADGMGNAPTQTTYEYEQPYFDPARRQFLGFGKVTTSTFQDRFGAYKTMTIYGNGDPHRKIIDDWGYSTERFRDGFELAGKAYFIRTGSYDREIVNRWERVPSGPVKAVIKRWERAADVDPVATGHRKWRQTNFTYDPFGNVTSVFDGGETRFLEDSNHNLVCPTNPVTQERVCVTQSLDSNARHLLTTYAQNTTGGAWIFKPSEMKTCTSSTCATSSSVLTSARMHYDGLPLGQIGSTGNLTRAEAWRHYMTTPAEPDVWSAKELTYDEDGINVIQAKDPLGALTTFEFGTPSRAYVSASNKTVTLGAGGNAVTLRTTTAWDERFGSPRTSIDENGRILATTLDGLGRITRTQSSPPDTPAGGLITLSTISYALQGVTGNTSQNSITTRLFDSGASRASIVYFDGLGRPVQTKQQTDPSTWVTLSQRYRWQGLAAKTFPYFTNQPGYTYFNFFATPLPQPVNEYSFDASRRITQIALRTTQNAQVDVVRTTYSNPTWSQTITDPEGYSTVYARDAWGQVVKVLERDNAPSPNVMATTALRYQLDDLVSIADAALPPNVLRFEYDTLRRKRAMFDENVSNCPGGAITCPVRYSYDLKGRLTTETRAGNESITVLHDEIDRPYRIDYSPDTESDIAMQYDSDANSRGRSSRVTRGPVEDSFTYDNWGRMTQRARSFDGTVARTNTTLDWTGRPLVTQYPDGGSVSYTYNLAGLVKTASISTGATTTPIASDVTYDPLGRSIVTIWGSGARTISTYDPGRQRLTRLAVRTSAGASLTDLHYTYDEKGNIASLSEDVEPAWKRDFSYDWGNRLHASRHFTHATGGAWVPQKLWTWHYDPIGNITSRSGSGIDGNYTYSGAGPHAVTRIGANPEATFTYDANGNMLTEKNGQVSYRYGADGLLLSMSDTSQGIDPGLTLSYGGSRDRVRKQWTDQAAVAHDLRYFGNHYEEHRSGSALDRERYVFVGGARAAYLTDRAPGKVFYLHPEMPGTAGLITDENSVAAMSRLYAPFGEVYETRLGENPGRHGYRGAEQDDESGQMHLGVRQYSAAMNRWPQPDPLISPLQPQSLNRYSYALNNPIRFIDPTGYKSYQKHLQMEPSPAGFNWDTAQGSDCNWGGCDLVTIGADGTIQVVGLALSAHTGPPAQLMMLREMSKAAREQAAAARNVAQEIVDGLNGINQADGAGPPGGADAGVNVGRTDKTAGVSERIDFQLSFLGKARALIHNGWQKLPGIGGSLWGKVKDTAKRIANLSFFVVSEADIEEGRVTNRDPTADRERPDEQGERGLQKDWVIKIPEIPIGGPPQPAEARDYGLVAQPPGYWDLYMPYGGIVPYAEPEF